MLTSPHPNPSPSGRGARALAFPTPERPPALSLAPRHPSISTFSIRVPMVSANFGSDTFAWASG
jgi:hypothetical protein